jgi:hypothetical protein
VIVRASSSLVVHDGQLDLENPWPGLASYDETADQFFSGRAAEAGELVRRIVDEPLTVLFGKSGLGKTSLLRAGVFPQLRDRNLLPIVVRLQIRNAAGPFMEQVCLRLLDELAAHGIEHAEPADAETPWEYLHRAGQEFWTPHNRLVRPVFVFDQFEELFTLGRGAMAQVEAFREDLADLVENRIPAAVARRADQGGLGDGGLDPRAMPYKVVIGIREDFLADLEGWRAVMPSLRRNRMRLLPMREGQALEAVCNERTEHLVSEPLARTIVTFLSSCGATEDGDCDGGADTTSTVEPALLSLFCQGVNEHRKRDRKATFDPELIETGKGTIVKEFYLQSLADQPPRVRRFVEEELITEHGYRNSYSVKDAIERKAVTAAELDTLINRHLLRHEQHLGADRVELTHDLLTKSVVEERDRRRRQESVDRERRQRLRFGGMAAAFALIAIVFAILAARASVAARDAEKATAAARSESERAGQAKTDAEKAENATRLALRDATRASKEAKTQAENARQASQRANDESRRSRSRALAAHAKATMNKDPELAIVLALKGVEQADTVEARSALIDAARYAWPYAVLHEADLEGEAEALALSADGTRLIVLAKNNTLSLWDVKARKAARVWMDSNFGAADGTAEGEALASVAFSPDQRWVAVGGRTAVTLLDASTGRVERRIPQPSAAEDRRIGFSPDGMWLASTQKDETVLHLTNLRDGREKAVEASHDIGGFAVLQDGKAVIVVSTRPLAAYRLTEAEPKWRETRIDVSSCVSPQSVSPGPEYVSATWKARACVFPAGPEQASPHAKFDDHVALDIVWSNGGHAFVELHDGGRELVVGRMNEADPLESRIKGADPVAENERSRFVSVNELGTRVAVIDNDEHKLVRVYSVAGYKPLLSRFESAFAIAPDGAWIAMARPALDEHAATIEVMPLEQGSADQLPRVRARIPVGRLPTRLFATAHAVVAVLLEDGRSTTSVFDPATGALRFEAVRGSGQPLGPAGELLLFQPSAGEPGRVIRTRDGTPITTWTAPPAADAVIRAQVSAGRQGLLAYHRRAGVSLTTATLYAVRGEALARVGDITDVPSGWWGRLTIAEDARSVSFSGQVWRLANGAASLRTPPAPGGGASTALASPRGRFEVQHDATAFRIVRRSDRSVIAVSDHWLFSADDRWLAVWEDKDGLRVFDLSRGEPVFRLEEPVANVTFAGLNILSVALGGKEENATMLIPLDWPSTERFVRWLTMRPLTADEECLYGFRDKACWNEAAVRARNARQ